MNRYEVAKKDGIPRACIRKYVGQSFCDRPVFESKEFMFHDDKYALQHYQDNKFLKVCEDCVDACIATGLMDTQTLAPMATRGEKNDK